MSIRRRDVACRDRRAWALFGNLFSARLVHDDPEEPAFERAASAEAAPVPECADEGVVYRLLPELLVAHNRHRNPQKSAVSIAVHALDPARFHHLKTQCRAFSFSRTQRYAAPTVPADQSESFSSVPAPRRG